MTAALIHVPGLGHTHEPENDARGGAQQEGARFQGKEGRLLRRALIADMILRRVPHRVIAGQLGCSKALVTKEAAKIRAEWKARHEEAFDRHVAESLAVLDRTRGVALSIATGTYPAATKLAALDRLHSSEDRRSKLLGMDKPTKVEHSGTIEVEAARQRGRELVDELARRRRSA